MIRWMHPQQGMIPPIKFIGIAEETGLIQPIGEWVFWTACRTLAEFNEVGLAGVKMGINISAMQMRNGNLPILAHGAIKALNLNPEDLVFEITESVAMQRPEETVAILDMLHNMGIKLAIDDFGTGYSSLSYLKMFPIDHIKLDRSFVDEIGQGGVARLFVMPPSGLRTILDSSWWQKASRLKSSLLTYVSELAIWCKAICLAARYPPKMSLLSYGSVTVKSGAPKLGSPY
ncbi:MAG: EAL domain-containing protein [Dechloromonas sp.]|uniref:EAL domain-containing protein n=1 Tax=Candidatus Dechloromonas phosphorivorans TaxID=2899244 RepID=A0A935K8J1_9RHOO|nr:EAL domain-containing protein [Candidatus Dechloromonas phosphorivorans]